MEKSLKKIKRSRASLTGGFVVGFAVMALVWLLMGELGWKDPVARVMVGLVVGGVMGSWVRVADL